MNLSDVTPLILTYNEAPNIRRILERLTWAQAVVIVDSGSTDETLEIVSQFPNTTVVHRPFDHFADQCNFGLQHVKTRWTLSLDADYVCPDSLPTEIQRLSDRMGGYAARFRYCIYGRPLRGTLYPSRTVLYQTSAASYGRDGHAHRVTVDGQIGHLNSVIDHDDHKPLRRWLNSQAGYAALEADKLFKSDAALGWKDRLRRGIVFAPFLTVFYCLLAKGLILDGWAGIYYTLQRAYAELLLSIYLLDRRLAPRSIDLFDTNGAASR